MRRPPSDAEIKRLRAKHAYVRNMLWSLAAALWLLMVVTVGGHLHLPFAQALVFLVLLGITAALRRLLKKVYHAWAVSAILAPVLAMLGLILVGY